jgi:hypothetical protein
MIASCFLVPGAVLLVQTQSNILHEKLRCTGLADDYRIMKYYALSPQPLVPLLYVFKIKDIEIYKINSEWLMEILPITVAAR